MVGLTNREVQGPGDGQGVGVGQVHAYRDDGQCLRKVTASQQLLAVSSGMAFTRRICSAGSGLPTAKNLTVTVPSPVPEEPAT